MLSVRYVVHICCTYVVPVLHSLIYKHGQEPITLAEIDQRGQVYLRLSSWKSIWFLNNSFAPMILRTNHDYEAYGFLLIAMQKTRDTDNYYKANKWTKESFMNQTSKDGNDTSYALIFFISAANNLVWKVAITSFYLWSHWAQIANFRYYDCTNHAQINSRRGLRWNKRIY